MNNIFIANAFSLQMLNQLDAVIKINPVDPCEIPVEAISAIGHADTAAVVSNILGREIPCNRVNVALDKGDVIFIAQLMGGRLPEGSTTLPEGFSITFVKVVVE